MLVSYWSKDTSNCQQDPPDIGIMWLMQEVGLASKAWSNQRNKIQQQTQQTQKMKMKLQKKLTRSISIGVKRNQPL